MSSSGTPQRARVGWLRLLLSVALCSSAFGCSSSDGTNTQPVEFTMTPDGGGAPFVITPRASTHAPAVNGCTLEIYDIEGTNRYFQYGSAGSCLGIFEATIDDGENEYFLSGQTLREFGSGSGPFASGTYSVTAGGGGSFTFHEDGFHSGM
jgi:hypothetical protein